MDKKRILVVDDEEVITRMVKLNLEQGDHYEVFTENDPRQALLNIRTIRPDLIILDVMMPGLDGGDIAVRLKDHPDTREIPIVFLTAAITAEEEKQHSPASDGHIYLHKPVDVEHLTEIIEAQFDTQHMA